MTISGTPPEEELEAAFLDIQQEYADEKGDSEYKGYIKLLKEVTFLNANYKQVHIAVEQLRLIIPAHLANPADPDYLHYIEQYKQSLHLLIGMSFDFTNPDTYEKNLQRCINRSAGIKIELDLKELNFAGMKAKFEAGKAPDDAYFNSWLITLSDHAGYHLTDSITVYEFCDRLRRLQKEASNQKPKQK